MRVLLFAIILLLLFPALQVFAGDAMDFRVIDVPKEEHGYQFFESQAVGSQEQFDAFIKQIEAQEFWNNKEAFLKVIAETRVDFSHESLVLIRHTEGSGSTQVSSPECQLQGEKLVCKIQRISPEVGTADVAFYCFGFIVKKDAVKQIEVWVSKKDKPQEVLEIH